MLGGFGNSGFGGFDTAFNSMYRFSQIWFILIFALIAFTIIRGLLQWNKNNHSPVLTVSAIVVAKRQHVSRRRSSSSSLHHTSTSYYITFEVESGDRIELHVTGSEYGQIIEGDAGKLTFQGTRYLGFERMR